MSIGPEEKARLEEMRSRVDALKLRKLADAGADGGGPSTAGYRVAQAEARLARAARALKRR